VEGKECKNTRAKRDLWFKYFGESEMMPQALIELPHRFSTTDTTT
jgi:hypothetical protein